jgi:hypothetical protein
MHAYMQREIDEFGEIEMEMRMEMEIMIEKKEDWRQWLCV